MLGWTGDFGDPANFLVHFGARALFGFNNPSLFKALAAADAETNSITGRPSIRLRASR